MTTTQEISQRTRTIAALNDAARATLAHSTIENHTSGELIITYGVIERGWSFVERALKAVREFADFTPDNDPYHEHDFAAFDLDGVRLNWKIDCYDRALKWGSPDSANPEVTRRVLTILLAEEY